MLLGEPRRLAEVLRVRGDRAADVRERRQHLGDVLGRDDGPVTEQGVPDLVVSVSRGALAGR